MRSWRVGILKMLRLRPPDTQYLDDEERQRVELQRARKRLRYIDLQAEIVTRRGKHIEPR